MEGRKVFSRGGNDFKKARGNVEHHRHKHPGGICNEKLEKEEEVKNEESEEDGDEDEEEE